MSNSIRINIDSQRVREAFAKAPQVMARNIEVRLSHGAEEVAREAKDLAPKAFSTLVNSIRAGRVGNLHYQVAPGVNYARPVEEGRKAGKQPGTATGTANGLMEWVKRKTGLQAAPVGTNGM